MQLAMIGLGRMGANMVRRLVRGGARVRAFDVSPIARAALHDAPEVQVFDSLEALVAAAPAGLPRVNEIGIDGPVLLFALAVSVVCGALFGLIPVFKYAGPHIAGAIRHGGRTISQSRERHRARSTLVVVQVALALVLLIGSGLMVRSFMTLVRTDPGFDPNGVLTFGVTNLRFRSPDEARATLTQLHDKFAAIPGVTGVATTNSVPFDERTWIVAVKPASEGVRVRREILAAASSTGLDLTSVRAVDASLEEIYRRAVARAGAERHGAVQ